MSTNFKSPKDQDDREKGTLRDQPQLLGIIPTALLANREGQPIQNVTSLITDFEMFSYMQGYYKEHLSSASAITCLFGDGDPGADRLKVKASAAKKFAQTEKPYGSCESS
jgi:hypothetical protein